METNLVTVILIIVALAITVIDLTIIRRAKAKRLLNQWLNEHRESWQETAANDSEEMQEIQKAANED